MSHHSTLLVCPVKKNQHCDYWIVPIFSFFTTIRHKRLLLKYSCQCFLSNLMQILSWPCLVTSFMPGYLNSFHKVGSTHQSNRTRERQISEDLGHKKIERKSEVDVQHSDSKAVKSFVWNINFCLSDLKPCCCLTHLRCRRTEIGWERECCVTHVRIYTTMKWYQVFEDQK